MAATDPSPMQERLRVRLDRLDLAPGEAARRAGLAPDTLDRLLAGPAPSPRGTALRKLAEVLDCSVAYLVGLDPEAEPPAELLAEAQGTLGVLAGDAEALLRAYGRLDLPSKAALLRVAQVMAGPEPVVDEVKPKRR